MKKLITLSLLLLLNNAFCQLKKDTMFVNVFGQKHGLLQLNIKGLSQDNRGYVWAGTEDGLHRFNAYEFDNFVHNPKDSLSIKDDHIRDLSAINDTLFIATNTNGIIGYEFYSNRFFDIYNSAENKETQFGYRVVKLSNEKIIFSTKNHIILYNQKNKQSNVIRLPKSQKENIALDFFKTDEDNILIATSNSGVLNLNIKSLKLTSVYSAINNTSAIYKSNGEIIIGTPLGLKILDSDKKLKKTSIKSFVQCFYKIEESLYVATKKGVYKYNLYTAKITPIVFKNNNDKIIHPVNIIKITCDKKGNIWFGSEGEGLFHYSKYQKKFKTTNIKLKEFPNIGKISSFNFLKNQDSLLWIASGQGIIKYNNKTKTFKLYNKTKGTLIYTIKEDYKKNIWAGGFGAGLLKYNQKEDDFKQFLPNAKKNNGITDDEIIEIIPINENTLWIATWTAGIFEFDINSEKFKPILINNKQLNRARISLVDTKKNIWLGSDEGLYKISKNNTKLYNFELHETKRISNNRIFAIKEDRKGNYWIGTASGLTKIDKNENTTLYHKQQGLPNDFIYSINIDKKDNIWVSTNYGIAVLDVTKNTFKNYTDKDGLQNVEFNGKAGYQDAKGIFYFGGINGINIFNPATINENPNHPKVYIESIELFNKPLKKNKALKNELEFKSSENVLTFNYTALNYLNPEKVLYQYKMEGFDNNWRPVTKDRTTTYTNLNPGEYIFKVKATNDVGVWNKSPISLKIKITPPWYAQLWFKILIILSVLLASILFYFYKINKLKKDKIKLEKTVYERTHELIEKNETLKKTYALTKKQKENISFLMKEMNHRVRNNLQIISSLLNIQANTIKNSETKDILIIAKNRILSIAHIQMLLNINSENVELGKFIIEISNKIIHTLSNENNPLFKQVYNVDVINGYSNKNLSLIGLILNELITNTHKYAFKEKNEKNTLNISCKKNKTHIEIKITDNGIGYSTKKNKNSSLGLELVAEMTLQLNAKLITDNSQGVSNKILIPL
ncbi:ligand-binding sensor domain-containing protein [Tenacibaculum bernardetii]|uniref:ligand-binding sensor domain-containing protein n=1 Tax=Tenacibaculum bernardetii TaxID=3021375 RepID=UPI0023AF7A5E|nr:two-component regulator propeller domain-containing protein [Tenacibaculum bernardetii]